MQNEKSTKKSTKLIDHVYAWLSQSFKPRPNWFAGPTVFRGETFVTRDGHKMILRISYNFIDVFDMGLNTWVMSIGDVHATSPSGEVEMDGKVIMLAIGRRGVNYLTNNYAIEELFKEGVGLYHISFIQLGEDMFIPIDPSPNANPKDRKIKFKKVVLSGVEIYKQYIPVIRRRVMMADLDLHPTPP